MFVFGFIGCGQQAHAHLDAVLDLFPDLSAVLTNSRSMGSAEVPVEEPRSRALSARTTNNADMLHLPVRTFTLNDPRLRSNRLGLRATHSAPSTVEISGRLNVLLGEAASPNKVRALVVKVVAEEGFEPPTHGL